jgi:predicted nucleic acid-binding Zn finger protein
MSTYNSSMLSLTISRMMVTISQSVSSTDTTNTLSKELLLALYSIFGSLLSPALDLVDRMAVSLVRGEEGGREVVTVRGSGGLRYTLLRGSHYCPCPSYQYKVVGRGDIICKHLLAVRLAMAMQRVNVETVPARQVMQLLEDLMESSP